MLWENQRRPLFGEVDEYSAAELYKLDRAAWTDDGAQPLFKHMCSLPSERWAWEGPWTPMVAAHEGLAVDDTPRDASGWFYAREPLDRVRKSLSSVPRRTGGVT